MYAIWNTIQKHWKARVLIKCKLLLISIIEELPIIKTTIKMSSKTIIIYQSRSGTTTKVTNILAEKINNDVLTINLKKEKAPPLSEFTKVIIGGSIRASMIQSGIKKFIENNINILKTKDVGLFLCCMEEGEKAEKQFNESYPEELRNIAIATGLLGGEFDFDNLNFLEKGIIKKVAGVTESVSNIKYQAIDEFAAELNKKT